MTATKKSEPIYANTDATVQFIQDWLKENDLMINVSIYTLLEENRRSPLSNSALAAGFPRGNRRKWGTIPFYRSGKQSIVYIRSEVVDWLETSVRPILEREKAEASKVP